MIDFSVLMAVYGKDNPSFYRIALDSVTSGQTLKPTQVVIVFDGPVPQEIESITFEAEQNNPHIVFTIVKQKVNQGLAAALNAGLEKCSFEYVARMDSDDYAVPDRFEKQMAYLTSNPQIDVLGGTIAEFKDDPQQTTSVRTVGLSHEMIVKMARHRTPLNHMTVIYKKSKVLAVGGYNVDFGKLEDYKLWVDMIANGCKFANLNDVLIHMRVGNGLILRRSNKREIQDWDNLQKDLRAAHIINRFDSYVNQFYIRAFTYTPSFLKKLAYHILLRRKA